MEDRRIGRRYAQALFQTATKYDVVASVEEDLNAVGGLLHNDKEFRHFFIAPQSSREEKVQIIEKLFSDRVTALTMQLLRVMLEKGRERDVEAVQFEFARLRREQQGIIHAVVTSAFPLENTHRVTLLAKLEAAYGKKFEADFDVDPRILGGVKVAYGSYVLDGTVQGAMSKLSDRLRHDVLKQA